MGKSSQLRLSDLRSIFRLLHEVQDISAKDPHSIAWRHHMLTGLCPMLHASHALANHWRNFTPTGDLQLQELTTVGSNNLQARTFWQQQVQERGFRVEPIANCMSRVRSRVATFARRELISDAVWYRSDIIRGFIDICGFDDTLLTLFRHRAADQISGTALYRLREDGPFSPREHSMLRLFNLELYRLYRQGKLRIAGEAMPSEKPPPPRETESQMADEPLAFLSPRTRQILQELLRGQSLKQIAQQLGLSRHTVNDHVKVIHRRLGVNTRAELLARCLGHNPNS